VHGRYHDAEYGFPPHDESVLFERLAPKSFRLTGCQNVPGAHEPVYARVLEASPPWARTGSPDALAAAEQV